MLVIEPGTLANPGKWSHDVVMKTIGAAEFKAHCLEILDNVDPEGIVITKRGKPVAKLMPPDWDFEGLYGKYKGQIEILGDIFSSGRDWDARA